MTAIEEHWSALCWTNRNTHTMKWHKLRGLTSQNNSDYRKSYNIVANMNITHENKSKLMAKQSIAWPNNLIRNFSSTLILCCLYFVNFWCVHVFWLLFDPMCCTISHHHKYTVMATATAAAAAATTDIHTREPRLMPFDCIEVANAWFTIYPY